MVRKRERNSRSLTTLSIQRITPNENILPWPLLISEKVPTGVLTFLRKEGDEPTYERVARGSAVRSLLEEASCSKGLAPGRLIVPECFISGKASTGSLQLTAYEKE